MQINQITYSYLVFNYLELLEKLYIYFEWLVLNLDGYTLDYSNKDTV